VTRGGKIPRGRRKDPSYLAKKKKKKRSFIGTEEKKRGNKKKEVSGGTSPSASYKPRDKRTSTGKEGEDSTLTIPYMKASKDRGRKRITVGEKKGRKKKLSRGRKKGRGYGGQKDENGASSSSPKRRRTEKEHPGEGKGRFCILEKKGHAIPTGKEKRRHRGGGKGEKRRKSRKKKKGILTR